ncbi:MAG: hypothetical protein J5847_05385, partial [Clostridia bacterium]|nr:hypothetical protein [Clostridia bacterium]
SYEDGPLPDAIWNSIIREATAIDKPLIGCMSDARAMKRGQTLLVSTTNFLFKAVIDQETHKDAIREATRKVLGEALTPRLVDENDILSFDKEVPATEPADVEPEDPDSVPADLANPSPDYHKPERKKLPEMVAEDLYEVKLSEERLAEAAPEEDDSDVKVADESAEEPNGPVTAEEGFSSDTAPTYNTLGGGLRLPDEVDDEARPTTFSLPNIDEVRDALEDEEDELVADDPVPPPEETPVSGADLYPELNESVGFSFADQELLGGIGAEPEAPAEPETPKDTSPPDPADETREEDPLDDFLIKLDDLGVKFEVEE